MDASLSLFKIVDAIQVPITVVNGEVQGSAKVSVELLPGLKFPMVIEARKMFINTQVGVLVKVHGMLNILIAHNPAGATLSAYLIDLSQLVEDGVMIAPETMFSKSATIRDAVTALRPGIVAAFFCKSGNWTRLTLPS